MTNARRLAGLLLAGAATVAVSATGAGTAHAAGPITPKAEGQVINIVNEGSRKCVDVRSEDGSDRPGARIQQYHCTSSSDQKFTLIPINQPDNGVYRIVTSRGFCVDVPGGSLNARVILNQFYCTDAQSEQWHYVQNHAPYGYFQNVRSGLCMDVINASSDDHVFLWQYPCNDTVAQHFRLV
jgi:hypothetical protein